MATGSAKKLNELLRVVRKNNPKADTALVKKAFWFAHEAHIRQKRESGEPYFIHPFETAMSLANYGLDSNTVSAALLHDVVEDTKTDRKKIEKEFGKEVSSLVEGVTKFNLLSRQGRKDFEYKNLQKIMIATVKDARVLLIKLADKIHNLKTLEHLPSEKQKEIAEFALEVYAPLANKLGVHEMKHDIENLCFPIVYPGFFKKFRKKIIAAQKSKELEMDKMIKVLNKKAKSLGKKYAFLKQHKSLYSIYQKMGEGGKHWQQIYDFSVLIILTDTEEECYSALHYLHKNFYPLPMKFKDFIAEPLMTTYQALHSTVMGPNGEPVKVYIRTKEMHKFAEIGIIASLNDVKKMEQFSKQRLNYWKIINAMQEKEFSSVLKSDFLKNTILAFTKKGRIIELPADSTPIDFAYCVNPKDGNFCSKAKVNETFVPLWHNLEFGDKVEIIAAKKMTIDPDWLDFVQSHTAK